MANLPVYQKFYQINNIDDLVKKFQETLMVSNKTFSYFVDWKKVKENVQKYEYEINILNYLTGVPDPKSKLREILQKNPEVLPLIPLIIAVRDLDISVICDPAEATESLRQFSFNKKDKLSNEEIEDILSCCENSGILGLFSAFKIKNLRDYLLGVETGLDSNARKNRSGSAMEALVDPILNKIQGIDIVRQKKFKYLKEKKGINVPDRLLNRKFDYVIIANGRLYNMEVNYYDGQGSKPQEIVDSYTNRANELKREGWNFIWLTDGPGWKTGTNQITNAFKDMEYVLNVEFARKGILDTLIKV